MSTRRIAPERQPTSLGAGMVSGMPRLAPPSLGEVTPVPGQASGVVDLLRVAAVGAVLIVLGAVLVGWLFWLLLRAVRG